MANRSWYQGGGIGLVDDKGRVTIPTALRQALAANAPKGDGKSGGTIMIGPHQNQNNQCLMAYDPAYADIYYGKLEKREVEHTADDGALDYNIKRAAAPAEPVPFDGSGRFIMPAFPRDYAGIGEHAFFYGVFDYIEIWDPRTLIETAGYPEVAKKMARFYMKERGVAL